MYDTISQSGVFQSIRQLYVAQVSTALSIWAANSDDGVGYLRADAELTNVQLPVQVIPDGQGGNFAPFISPSGKQEFIVSDMDGVLSLFEQDTVLASGNRCHCSLLPSKRPSKFGHIRPKLL